MPLNTQIIKETVSNGILNYVENNLEKVRPFQILDLLIPKERKIRSIVGGLETSQGKTLWEPLAKSIATDNGFVVVPGDLQSPLIMPAALGNTLQIILESRILQNGQYNASTAHSAIKQVCQQFINNPIQGFGPPPRGSGVDIWLQRDGIDYFFDTKTVQPNIAKFREFLSQLFNWYAYFYSGNPNGNAIAKIVFPYNPYKGDFWENSKANGRPLEPNAEAWVENEFWDFISGEENTFSIIKNCFIELKDVGSLQEQLDSLFSE